MSDTTVIPYTLYVSSASGKSEIVHGTIRVIEIEGETDDA